MQDPGQVFYSPPVRHKEHLRNMCRWLIVFFGVLVVMVVALIVFAGRLAPLLPFSAEKNFVRPYEEMASRWFADGLGDGEIEAYLEELVDEVAVQMELPQEIELSVHYLDDGEKNAFATLGGHVFILRGILESVPDENSLVMVLAHELSHIKHRDPLASMGRGVALQMILSYFTGNSRQSEDLASLGGNLGLLSYSREQEARSDMEALHLLHKRYGHVGGFDVFFRGFLRDDGGAEDALPTLFQTHPDIAVRIGYLEAAAEEHGYSVGRTTPFPDWMGGKLSVRMRESLL